MNKKQFARILLALLVCISLLVSVCLLAGADFGDFAGDGDYGGGDYGGGFDFGGGDDYSYSSDYSSDGDGFGGFISIAIVVIIILVFVIKGKITGNKSHQSNSQAPGAQRTQVSALLPMSQYSQLDANFSEAELTQKLANLYVQMQQCWTAKDISSLRPYFADSIFAQMFRQLDQHRRNKRTNYVERIAVLGVTLKGYRQQGGNDYIIAEIRARITDYTLSDVTGELLSGNRNAEKIMTYEYELMRPTGKITVPETQCAVTNCPNCGAPVNINRTAKCPYCDSIITVENNNFVINSIRGISQQTL